jgi:hypothetical protein
MSKNIIKLLKVQWRAVMIFENSLHLLKMIES